MPIYEILKGGEFEPKHIEAMGQALEAVCSCAHRLVSDYTKHAESKSLNAARARPPIVVRAQTR
jgi:hypothetical protein